MSRISALERQRNAATRMLSVALSELSDAKRQIRKLMRERPHILSRKCWCKPTILRWPPKGDRAGRKE